MDDSDTDTLEGSCEEEETQLLAQKIIKQKNIHASSKTITSSSSKSSSLLDSISHVEMIGGNYFSSRENISNKQALFSTQRSTDLFGGHSVSKTGLEGISHISLLGTSSKYLATQRSEELLTASEKSHLSAGAFLSAETISNSEKQVIASNQLSKASSARYLSTQQSEDITTSSTSRQQRQTGILMSQRSEDVALSSNASLLMPAQRVESTRSMENLRQAPRSSFLLQQEHHNRTDIRRVVTSCVEARSLESLERELARVAARGERKITIMSPHRKKAIVLPKLVLPHSDSDVFAE